MKKYLFRLLRKLRILKFLNIKTNIRINDANIVIPILGGTGFDNIFISELWMIDILKKINVNSHEVFIDVGVNIGQTLIKLKSVYPDINYIGIEPNPLCINYAEQLAKSNNWKDVQLLPVGLSDKTSLAVLEHYSDNPTDSSASIVKGYRKDNKIYQREIVAIFDVEQIKNVWSGKSISTIKIDVEGAELGVLKSFTQCLEEYRPNLIVEILPVYHEENIERFNNQKEIEFILSSLNYKIYRIIKDKSNRFDCLKLIDSIGIHKRLEWCDYLFLPDESEIN